MAAQSGWGRGPADGGGGGGNSFFSSAASSNIGGSGQLNPARSARCRKRRTVPLPSTQIFEICRSLSWDSKCNLRTSLILRMGVRSWGNIVSFRFKRPCPSLGSHSAAYPARSFRLKWGGVTKLLGHHSERGGAPLRP